MKKNEAKEKQAKGRMAQTFQREVWATAKQRVTTRLSKKVEHKCKILGNSDSAALT